MLHFYHIPDFTHVQSFGMKGKRLLKKKQIKNKKQTLFVQHEFFFFCKNSFKKFVSLLFCYYVCGINLFSSKK